MSPQSNQNNKTLLQADNLKSYYQTFGIIYFVTCKSRWVIYLMEYYPWTNPRCIRKSESRINTHNNYLRRAVGSPCDNHFQNPRHKFNEHAKFTITEKKKTMHLSQKIFEYSDQRLSPKALKLCQRYNWLHLIKLFQFKLSFVFVLFTRSFFKSLLSSPINK